MKGIAALAFVMAVSPILAQNTFHGNSAHTGVYDSPGPRQLGGVKWAFKAGGPIVTSPSILDGVVYIAALDGHLYAIDQETGKEKWNFKSRMPIASTPAVPWKHALFCFIGRLTGGSRPQDRATSMGVCHRIREKI